MSFAIPRNSKKNKTVIKTIGGLEGSTSFDPGFFRWESLSTNQYFMESGQLIATSHEFSPQMVVKSKGNPLISGKPRLVKYNNLARWNVIMVLLLKCVLFCWLFVCPDFLLVVTTKSEAIWDWRVWEMFKLKDSYSLPKIPMTPCILWWKLLKKKAPGKDRWRNGDRHSHACLGLSWPAKTKSPVGGAIDPFTRV